VSREAGDIHSGQSFVATGTGRRRTVDRSEQGNRDNMGAASFPRVQCAGPEAVAATQGLSVRCVSCCWNGHMGALVAFRCPECSSPNVARAS
jgi:hypothetical protein